MQNNTGLFRHYEMPTIKQAFAQCETINLEENTLLFSSSNHFEYIYFLLEGVVCYSKQFGTKTKNLYWLSENIINLFLLYIDDYKYEVKTTTAVKLAKMHVNDFRQNMKENPDFFSEIIIWEGYVLNCYINELQLLAFSSANQKIEKFIRDIKINNKRMCFEKITQNEIAEALAMHPVTLSKNIREIAANSKTK